MQAQVSPLTIKHLCDIILNNPYRTGRELIQFFSDLGVSDQYDTQLSRPKYTVEKLNELNRQKSMCPAIEKAVDSRLFLNSEKILEGIVEKFNVVLEYDGLVLAKVGLYYKLKYLPNAQQSRPAIKNIIFASNGPKPDIVLKDALSNEIEIVSNAEYCLVYDGDTSDGVSQQALVYWWAKLTGLPEVNYEAETQLRSRLKLSIPKESKPAHLLFDTYYARRRETKNFPALLPEVYLHFDPKTLRERNGIKVLNRQRMDFLLLLPDDARIVIEVDGKQHYAEGEIANPKKYSDMVHEDRALRLLGYEVYRFGGHELDQSDAKQQVTDFFDKLFKKHKIE